ncbi:MULTISPECIES: alpha/beta hydrolase [unclassified Pseudomonas]|uniref:alpha/beta hydrolase n=1 Tax=unclassified Pseudomonas TaxID=196821 RepID=UPI0002A32EF9|nr:MULTISPECIES: alpha/beta hydrolase [unclassified Pseudomonas]MBB1610450.1 lipase [Pseudomonas sp. UMC76]MBB1637996.1 lipase [Pseudomonas sp. UME83]NTX91978.1 alpha/beta hydrolase [Pseudomonas sp. UMA643]NTY22182.1 alpha/beta hydrolase [Pseudomonas sp. UMC3103]NTY28460.1 alpha/beta hydrolase [Pseudomonas sp. UMA603]
MSLHLDLEAFLELVELGRLSGKSQAFQDLGAERARRDFEAASLSLDSPVAAGLEVERLNYPSRDGQELAARLYRRSGATGPAPVLLYLHGGGYVVGSLDSHDALCRRLALASRCAVLAVDYRLAPAWRFPTALEDVADALVWLREQSAALGLDPARVAFGGDSVGASLALVLALQAAAAPETAALRPRALLLAYPVADASRQRPSHQRYASGYLLESATLEWFYDSYARNPQDRLDWRFSPLLAPSLDGLPPVHLALAGHDPLYDEGLALAERLREAGNDLTLDLRPDLTHDFMRMHGLVGEVAAIHASQAAWLDRWLVG